MISQLSKRILALFTMILLVGSFYFVSLASASTTPLHTPLIIGSQGSGNGQFSSPSGVAVDSSGNIYVADTYNDRIQKFNSDGTWQKSWGSYGSGNGQFNRPAGLAVDASGNVYVADTLNSRIQKFNSDGTWQKSWGSYGSGNGQLAFPRGVAVDSSGNVYVADTYNNRIQKFNSDGTWQESFGSYGSGENQLSGPSGVAVDSAGSIFVADTLNNRLVRWGYSEINGNLQWTFSAQKGFSSPSVMNIKKDIDSEGFGWYIAETGANRIYDLDPLLGSKIFRLNFSHPMGVDCDTSGNIYVADTGNHRIVIFNSKTVGINITIQPSDATVNAGRNTSYTVTAIGNNLTYQWQVNAGSVFSNITDGGVYSGATTATLTITGTTAEMNGYHYKVIIEGTGGVTESNSAGLTVKPAPVPPTITIQPSNQTVTAGQTATFSVGASGDAPLSYQWKKDGTNISGATSATLSIANAQLSDAGSYTVVVTNGAGNVTSNAAALTVNPSISPAPMKSNITVTNNVYGTSDTVAVSGLNLGDVIKVYNAGGKVLGTATVSNGQTSTTVSITQLGTSAGKIYVSVTSTGKLESPRTEVSYSAEPIADTTAPQTRYHLDPIFGQTSAGRQYIKGFNVSLKATDADSSVTQTVYRINGDVWTPYTNPFTIYAGVTHTVEYYSTDNAGNKETPNVMNFDKGTFTGAGSY